MDTVGDERPVRPVLREGGWESEDEAILGADNKAAVAVMLELARRVAIEGAPVGVELCFTVREEQALRGAFEVDPGRFRASIGYVFDHATPIGEVIGASPTYVQWEAVLEGRAAHAGISPEDGRNAIVAASRAISRIPTGRIDASTTANVASIAGGTATHGTNIVAPDCRVTGEARSLEEGVAERLADEVVEAFHDAANEPDCSCDVDVTLERSFEGYRVDPDEAGAKVAMAALRDCGHEPRLVDSGGGSDANAFRSAGLAVINLANGTERPHMPDERVSAEALEQMLDVTIALTEQAGEELR
jgi:tripeptide aminopeptidase